MTRRLLKTQAELLEYSPFLPITYTTNLINMNIQNLAQIKNAGTQTSLIVIDHYLEEALSALATIQKISIENQNINPSLVDNLESTPPNTPSLNDMTLSKIKKKLITSLKRASDELDIIDDIVQLPKTPDELDIVDDIVQLPKTSEP